MPAAGARRHSRPPGRRRSGTARRRTPVAPPRRGAARVGCRPPRRSAAGARAAAARVRAARGRAATACRAPCASSIEIAIDSRASRSRHALAQHCSRLRTRLFGGGAGPASGSGGGSPARSSSSLTAMPSAAAIAATTDSRRSSARRPRPQLGERLLLGLARDLQVDLLRDAVEVQRTQRASQISRARAATSALGRSIVACAATASSTVSPNSSATRPSSAASSPAAMSSRSSVERVEAGGLLRQGVVELGQPLGEHLLDLDLEARAAAGDVLGAVVLGRVDVGEVDVDGARLAGRRALELLLEAGDEHPAAELDHLVAAPAAVERLAVDQPLEVDDEQVAGRAPGARRPRGGRGARAASAARRRPRRARSPARGGRPPGPCTGRARRRAARRSRSRTSAARRRPACSSRRAWAGRRRRSRPRRARCATSA